MVYSTLGQTVILPDTNLRNALLLRYPAVMDGNNLLVSEAAAITGTLNLRNANIYNATGIEHFTGITTLELSDNKLVYIPDISGTTGLVNFYATNNQLTSLPDLSALTMITDFQAMHNQLNKLPDLSGSAAILRSLYFSSNQITELPDLAMFPNLAKLVIGNNPLKQPIDFSSCTKLVELHIHQTGAKNIIGLEKLTKLTTLFAWENQITDFSGLDSITTMETIVILDNPMQDLPYLDNKPNLIKLAVKDCYLTFEDILPVKINHPTITFTYTPQKVFKTFNTQITRANSQFSLQYPELSPSGNNIYVWSKNGNVLDSSSSPVYTFNPVVFPDSGKYSLKVYNTAVTDLTLEYNTFYLIVKPCIEFKIPFVDIRSKDCSQGYSIDLSNAFIAGGTAPFTYEVNNGIVKEKHSDELIKNIPAGKYGITILDANKCAATDTIVLNRIEKCDPVLTPNGDGIADSYYIEDNGTAKIYDLRRKLIKTLSTPAIWDGTDQSGTLVDAGFYIIIFNEKKSTNVTVIR